MPSTKKAVVKRAGRHDLVLPNVTRVATRPQVPPRPKNPTNTGKRRTTRPLGGLWNGFHRFCVGAKPREGRGGDTVDLIPVWMAACIGCVEVFDANPDPTVGFVPIGDALVWHWSITEDVPDSYFHCALTCHAEASARAAHLLECPNATQYRYLAVQWELEQEQTKEKKKATKQAMALELPSRDTSLAIIGEHYLLIFISHRDNEDTPMSSFPRYVCWGCITFVSGCTREQFETLSWAEQNDVLQRLDLYDVTRGEVTYSILVDHILSCPLASAEARDTAQFLDQNSTNLIELIGDDIPPRLNPMSADEEPQLEWGVETDDRGRRSYCDHKDNWGRGKSDGCRGGAGRQQVLDGELYLRVEYVSEGLSARRGWHWDCATNEQWFAAYNACPRPDMLAGYQRLTKKDQQSVKAKYIKIEEDLEEAKAVPAAEKTKKTKKTKKTEKNG